MGKKGNQWKAKERRKNKTSKKEVVDKGAVLPNGGRSDYWVKKERKERRDKIIAIIVLVIYCIAWPTVLVPDFFEMFEGEPFFKFSLMTYSIQLFPFLAIPIVLLIWSKKMLGDRLKKRTGMLLGKVIIAYSCLLFAGWLISYFLICNWLENRGYIECTYRGGRGGIHSYVHKDYVEEAKKKFGYKLRIP